MLRAYAKYLRQVGFAFSQAYIEETLAHNPAHRPRLVAAVPARFDPAGRRPRSAGRGHRRARSSRRSTSVANLDEDRILRRFLTLIQATLRTNFFQRGGRRQRRSRTSRFKFDSREVDELPLPRPLFEIFVYSPARRGLHLRGGKVARGGLRWSDRREDFRTEVLGLVKAQMVKNAVIVPVGSKGGFVRQAAAGRRRPRGAPWTKASPATRPSCAACSTSPTTCVGGKVVPPPDVVRHDGDDPYLVVAADKGTATFSDIANGVSARVRLLAGRRVRLRRLGRLRPQEDGHHRARRLGSGQAPLPRDRPRHPDAGLHRASASATCRATCSATACCCRSTSSCSAAFDHRHIFLDPDPDPARELRRARAPVRPAALVLGRLRHAR